MQASQFELLAPGGDIDAIKAAIAAGADAIYCGLDRFNARNRAGNLSSDQLSGVLALAHQHHCKIFLTLNIVILETELPALLRLLNQLVNTDLDGVIIQDLGLAYLLKRHFPSLDVHASTQLNTHNVGQMALLKQLGVSRVNLSRELSLGEISPLCDFAEQQQLQVEVFVHGSYCIGFSGLCYLSSERNGASGNRGRCSQPCRDQYQTTATGHQFPLNMKDNSAFSDLPALAKAGVYSLKIEGRIKKPHYVYTVVDNWRQQIDNFVADKPLSTNTDQLYTVFNRDFSNGFLRGAIGKEMYIDNPRDNAVQHFVQQSQAQSQSQILAIKKRLYNDKTSIISTIAKATQDFSIAAEQPKTRRYKAVELPSLQANTPQPSPLHLSVLINQAEDAALSLRNDVEVYFQLPMGLAKALPKLRQLFAAFPGLKPWFPSILIAEDFSAAGELLHHLRPSQLISNNLGVGKLAQDLQLSWVAGPLLNTTNSYSIRCLRDAFSAKGAFISNELNHYQIKRITRPADFRGFYSIFHPNNLLTSRQCLFHQTEGCKKHLIDKSCLKSCAKHSGISNLSGRPYYIQKDPGSHNSIYADQHVLNLDIISQAPGVLSDVLIDLSHVESDTKVSASPSQLIQHFKALLSNTADTQLTAQLQQRLQPSLNNQYLKGL